MNLIFAVLQHAAEAGEAHAESPNVFAITSDVMFWTVVIFLVLLVVLSKFAFPAILGYAEAREKRIQDALDAARTDREESQRMLEEQRQALNHARTEAQALIADAQKAAERVRREMLDKARADQDEIVARAKAEIELEKTRAIESLRKEAVDLAMAAASRLVSKKLDAQEDRRIVTDFLASVDRGQVAAGK